MASNALPSTSKERGCKRKSFDDNTGKNVCGLTRNEYDAILAALDSAEEPFMDSGSEYEPDADDHDSSDEEASEILFENEPQDNIEDNINIDSEPIVDDIITEVHLQNALKDVLSIKWDETPFIPQIHAFYDTNSGSHVESIEDKSDPLSYFLLFVDEELAKVVVNETNKYASAIYQAKNMNWKDVDINEFFIFLGVMLLTGRHRKNKLRDNWSTDVLMHTPIFSQMMSRNRFQAILSVLHFSENADKEEGDSFHKVRHVFQKLAALFQKHFSPFQKLAIDESLVLFKGRLRFKLHI